VAKACRELFAGHSQSPAALLQKVFAEAGGYDDLILVTDIPFTSHCEHHMLPSEEIAVSSACRRSRGLWISRKAPSDAGEQDGKDMSGAKTTTLRFLGSFEGAAAMQARFLHLVRSRR
jgi:GTP cyclohydrolase I